MTEEERIQLLIEELCPRLPYGVRGTVPIEIWNGDWGEDGFQIFVTKHVEVELTAVDTWSQDIRVETVGSDFDEYVYEIQEEGCGFTIEDFTPILRPLGSMTEEEREELKVLCDQDLNDYAGHLREGHGLSRDGHYKFMETRQLKWLLKNHFDFNNVMEKLKDEHN